MTIGIDGLATNRRCPSCANRLMPYCVVAPAKNRECAARQYEQYRGHRSACRASSRPPPFWV